MYKILAACIYLCSFLNCCWELLSENRVETDILSNHVGLYALANLRHDAWSSGSAVVVGEIIWNIWQDENWLRSKVRS